MNTAQIVNPEITIEPSEDLIHFVKELRVNSDDLPCGIAEILNGKDGAKKKYKPAEHELFYKKDDQNFVRSLDLKDPETKRRTCVTHNKSTVILKLQDLYWLYDQILIRNKTTENKIFLHDLLKGCLINLPQNQIIPRSEELEKRCQRLKAEQQNKEYNNMTKNVDSLRKKFPEDTISYQLKEMNRHLIAVFQFVVSVLTGFAFGIVGIEFFVEGLDFGFRLLLGIVCALVIAVAELYFLAKKLNGDLDVALRTKFEKKKVM